MADSGNPVGIEVAPLAAADLPAAAVLSKAVQWPHRLEDWQFALSLGQGLAAFSGRRLVGTAMAWEYDGAATRVGMVLVDPNMQRSGIGATLMNALLGPIRTSAILLNATEAGEPLYRRLGFEVTAAVVQHQGIAAPGPRLPLPAGARISAIDHNDISRLAALDAAALGVRRPHVIAALVDHGDAVALDVANEIVGFAVCRQFGRGHVIGPVIARDLQAAQALMAHWIDVHAGRFVRVDVPADCGLSAWLDARGLVHCGQVNTMCRGTSLATSGHVRTFALVNQALG